ncbi:selenocysteine-specific translation elongation factor [Cupriavidus malaysiensis]|uniref:Selenocysteine-specific elongation factor n=1 Tax=Cupriavidus malaysiensis TaxID=367825 RepID=A0A1D9ICN0_9BURK|nr:selenocysteine-specific translation elongation factor [Cupriavidus malaysiensis]AOZ09862.1 selenocysteine-specific translation elongation factor [Cupriavidus malaysiensis]
MIVGTAGHIDHGKTTLVRALTGVDTDRLKEEKARGISIELGYAYTPLPGGEVLGYIDVPGHERLIHTMAAGASGIDLALLVVAADDGVMPQTREHVAILALLGVRAAVVALSKADRVEPPRLEAVRAEISALLADTPFAGAPVFALAATRAGDAGVAALRAHLHAAALALPPRAADGPFRLAVDRVFTLAGHGTVVTGTVFGGQVRVGDSVRLAPSGLPARVRSIHAQQQPAEAGHAGQRCALNLAGIDKDAIARGDWVLDPVLLAPTTRLDVRLALLPGSGHRLAHWAPLHIHLGTTHRLANIVLLEGDTIEPGAQAFAQLVFAAPLCAWPGDRFIARNPQATRTVGGGVVLDPFAPERRRRAPQRLAYLRALQQMAGGSGLAPLLAQAPRGITVARLRCLAAGAPGGWRLPADALRIGAPTQDEASLILAEHWQALQTRVLEALAAFHARQPDEPGPDAGTLRRIAFAGTPVPDPLWLGLLDALAGRGALRRQGAWLQLPTHSASLSAAEQALQPRVMPLLEAGAYDPPWVRDLAAALQVPEDAMRQLLRKLARQGQVHQVVRDLFYTHAHVQALAALVSGLVAHHGSVDAARFRDAVGLGRKRAIQVLEFLDRVGYTRRVGNARMLRPDGQWQQGQANGAAVPSAAAHDEGP